MRSLRSSLSDGTRRSLRNASSLAEPLWDGAAEGREVSASPLGVMHLIDTLDRGGAEQMAVNLVNLLPRDRFSSYLCTTRRDGSLADAIRPEVGRLRLERRRRLDVRALRRLAAFNRAHGIQLMHAHGTSLFFATAVACFPPYPKVVWHDHVGDWAVSSRPTWLYRLATRNVAGVIAVTTSLAAWARSELHVRPDRVWHIPNFVAESGAAPAWPDVRLDSGARIACVANFRPQKDHLTLLAAMEIVVRAVPSAELLLIGAAGDRTCLQRVKEHIARRNLAQHVLLLGGRSDVPDLLRSCHVGVLSSSGEGLPLALIEYGVAGIAVVATEVGECPEILDHGRAGILVPPRAPERLAAALISLLLTPARRRALAWRLSNRVRSAYSPAVAIERLCGVYSTVLATQPS